MIPISSFTEEDYGDEFTVMGGDAKKILSKSQIGHKNLESHISINKCVFGIFHDTIVLRFFLAFQ